MAEDNSGSQLDASHGTVIPNDINRILWRDLPPVGSSLGQSVSKEVPQKVLSCDRVSVRQLLIAVTLYLEKLQSGTFGV